MKFSDYFVKLILFILKVIDLTVGIRVNIEGVEV